MHTEKEDDILYEEFFILDGAAKRTKGWYGSVFERGGMYVHGS